jgi:hypothetical protein
VNLVARTAFSVASALLLTATAPKTVGWNHTIGVTPEGGHLTGNPDAPVKLVEYVSYTCPQCATFMIQSDGALQVGYLSSGKVSVELRHLVLGPVDLAAAMLADCGPPAKFALNHAAMMRSQSAWGQTLARAGPAQKQRWETGSLLSRNRAIATDMHFYEIMESRGYDRMTTERCLSNQTVANRIGAQSKAGYASGIISPPSFTINGTLETAHTWAELRPKIDASL